MTDDNTDTQKLLMSWPDVVALFKGETLEYENAIDGMTIEIESDGSLEHLLESPHTDFGTLAEEIENPEIFPPEEETEA